MSRIHRRHPRHGRRRAERRGPRFREKVTRLLQAAYGIGPNDVQAMRGNLPRAYFEPAAGIREEGGK